MAMLGMLVVLAGCQSGRGLGVAPLGLERSSQRIPLVLPESEVQGAAAQAYQRTIQQAREAGLLETDPSVVTRVREVFRRLVSATAAWQTDVTAWPWEVQVVRAEDVDAWCLPGGRMIVHSGALTRAGLTDDELAALLSHEMAHVLRGHPRERMAQQVAQGASGAGTGTVMTRAAVGVAGPSAPPDLRPDAYLPTVQAPYSRAHEAEADRIGVELAARAGFDPRAARSMWGKVQGLPQAGTSRWPAGHPGLSSRLDALDTYAQRVMPLFEQAARP
jgi:predicted Zn-dependent protease